MPDELLLMAMRNCEPLALPKSEQCADDCDEQRHKIDLEKAKIDLEEGKVSLEKEKARLEQMRLLSSCPIILYFSYISDVLLQKLYKIFNTVDLGRASLNF